MLEQIAYQSPRVSEERQPVYQVGDLESLSASALYGYGSSSGNGGSSGGVGPSFTGSTGYFPLTTDGSLGVTHHAEGLGKLKVNEGGIEYGVPLADILNKPLIDWRIDKK